MGGGINMASPLSLLVAMGKQTWLDYKENKRIKERTPVIKMRLETDAGIALRRGVLEALGAKKIFVETNDFTGDYLDWFKKEGLINIIDSANTDTGIMYLVTLTPIGKRFM